MFSGMITWDPIKTGKRETFKVPPRLQIEVGGREHALGCSPVCGPESGAGEGLYGFGSPAQATLTLQSCRGETPASPHPQGSRPVPWTSGHPTHLLGTQRTKPWVLGRVYRKQLLASQPAQAQVMPGPLPAAVLTSPPQLACVLTHTHTHTHTPMFLPLPPPWHSHLQGVSVCIFGFWLVSEQAEDLSFQSICWVQNIIYSGSGLGD